MSLLYRKGSSGQEVKRIQRALKIKADGKFGPKTEEAVKSFQGTCSTPSPHRPLGIANDGVVGPETRKELGIDIYAGVDVSHHNGNIPWGNVDKSQVEFVWAKMSQGVDFYDTAREHNLEGCRSNGIPIGGYHFPSPHIGGSQDPKLEVQQFLRALGKIQAGDMLPVLDLEAGVKGDPDFNRQWALEWLQEFENETGIRCAVYTAKWYVNGYLKRKVGDLKNYPLWVADYSDIRNEPDSLCGWGEWSAWQWTSKGDIRGLGDTGIRKCDRNWIPGGPCEFQKLKTR